MYTEASQKMEKLIRTLDIALMKWTPVLQTWLVLFFSFYTYFTTDLNDSALELPVPMWYVEISLFILLSQIFVHRFFESIKGSHLMRKHRLDISLPYFFNFGDFY